MIDFRLYRIAFLPTAVALLAAMFALEPVPPAFEPAGASSAFDQQLAARTAEQIVELAPSRTPGSEGDKATADLVRKRFRQLDLGLISEQEYESTFDGEEVSLRNVILTLPAESDETIVLLAPRDTAQGAGAASSAAATALLLEAAAQLAVSEHEKTLVLVSTTGSAEGAAGARELARGLPSASSIEAVVAISQPGASRPRAPFVVGTSSDSSSPSAQLAATAATAVEIESGGDAQPGTGFGDLARLAIPSGLGEQAALIEEGLDAVAISSAGEPPLPLARDEPEDLSGPVLGRFGRAAMATVTALDQSIVPLEHGPDAYVRFAGNLLPGWSLSLLSLALILPAGVAAVDALARAGRRRLGVGAALAWAALATVPAIVAVLALLALALAGLVARPAFPFDPAIYAIGAGEIVILCLVVAAGALAWLALRPWRRRLRAAGGARAAALGLVGAVFALLAWLANPFLALLLVAGAHAWVLHGGRGGVASLPVSALVALAAAAPPALALAYVIGVLELGAAAPWHLAMMVAEGQIGPFNALSAAAILSVLGSVVGLSLARESGAETQGSRPHLGTRA